MNTLQQSLLLLLLIIAVHVHENIKWLVAGSFSCSFHLTEWRKQQLLTVILVRTEALQTVPSGCLCNNSINCGHLLCTSRHFCKPCSCFFTNSLGN